MGIPAAFLISGLHSDYHRPTDSAEMLDDAQMQTVTRTLAAIAWMVGNQPVPPEPNEKLPQRLMDDMKAVREQGWGKK